MLREDSGYRIGDIRVSTGRRHLHRVETYGLTPRKISFITDTKFFPDLPNLYRDKIPVIHVVRLKPIGGDAIEHLSVEDVKSILKKVNPRLTIVTHFGMTMITAKPWVVAPELEKELELRVIAASGGMKIDPEEV